MDVDERWRHPTEPHPHEIHRWEDDGGRAINGHEPRPPEKRRGFPVLRTIAIILILLAFLGGGLGAALGMAMELLWLWLIILLVGVVLGLFGGGGPPAV